jgi:hypothetical protein
MEKIKVRIVKCSFGPPVWYHDQIGAEFFVYIKNSTRYTVAGLTGLSEINIDKADCEVMAHEEPAPRRLPFDLDKALAGQPVATRDGRKVAGLIHTGFETKWPLVGMIEGCEAPCSWTLTGHCNSTTEPDPDDLFLKSHGKRTVWVNLHKLPSGRISTAKLTFSSEEKALQYENDRGTRTFIGTFPITF